MSYVIEGIICLLVGAGAMFFFLKNNPKYVNVAKLGKEKLQEVVNRL